MAGLAPWTLHVREVQLLHGCSVRTNMQVTRQTLDAALGKILMPWVTLGFGAALLALATEVLEIVCEFRW